jgi:hypothetical protein
MSNLSLWDSVCETDPSFTKVVNQRGGYTSITPQYQIREATRIFGLYGMGWGFDSIDYDYQFVADSGLVIVNAVFFYVWDGKKATFPITNAWPMKNGTRVDPDFAKKAETNTMSKALSKLGFSADVFLGQFDDPEYVNMMDAKARIESGDEDRAREANEEFKAWFNKQIEGLFKHTHINSVYLVANSLTQKIDDRLTILKASDDKKSAVKAKLSSTVQEVELLLKNKGDK